MKKEFLFISLFLSLAFCQISQAQTFTFTYQASLKDGGVPANGNYDFEFRVFDALSGGNQVSGTLTLGNFPVTNGLVTVSMGFGGVFTGPDRFLEVRMRQTGSPNFTTLAPRTFITSAPYSLRSQSAQTADNALQLGGVAANQYVLTGDARLSDARNPLAGSANYIQNTQNASTQQPSSNFNISGVGTAGVLTANIVSANTRFNLGGISILSRPGFFNLFAGENSGANNSSGGDNTFFGALTGESNTTGFNNSFFGTGAGRDNITGIGNAIFGTLAGPLSNGNSNSFFGSAAGNQNSVGSSNSFFGNSAGNQNTSGGSNTFFGAQAGKINTVGQFNTILGGGADVLSNDLTNATAVGANAAVSTSNSLVLGSINGVNTATADTNVGIGTPAPLKRLHIRGAGDQEIMLESSDTGGIKWTLQSSDGASGGRLEIINRTANSSKVTILANGNFGVGMTAPDDKLDVNGIIGVATLGAAGSTSLCRNTNNQISTCSSSIRYKTNINPFGSGLDLIRRLRPVSFNWKSDNQADFGLVAEEVATVEPLLTTRNDKGEVEGVKYDRVGVVLVNAVNEQQAQIEAQARQIDEQKEIINEQQKKLKDTEKQFILQKSDLDALKVLVCSQNQTAQICQPKN